MKCDTKALGHSIQGATTLSIKGIFETLSINGIHHNDNQHNSTSAIILNVIILSVTIYIVMLNVAMRSGIMLSVVAPNTVLLH